MEYAITIKNLYHQNANKTTIPNLSSSRLKAFPIPLPPLEEQKAITDILSTVQNAIEKTEKVINATKQLKKSCN
jgi:type I restriction enzyme S subunit